MPNHQARRWVNEVIGVRVPTSHLHLDVSWLYETVLYRCITLIAAAGRSRTRFPPVQELTLTTSLVIPECGPLLTRGRIVEAITPRPKLIYVATFLHTL